MNAPLLAVDYLRAVCMSDSNICFRAGGLFTVAMARLNVRIRSHLFGNLLQQEIGFFDKTKTGEITSRLAADTTTVADQVCLNLNVMLRSLTQAALVLVSPALGCGCPD